MTQVNKKRCRRLIRAAIDDLELDLGGLTVLTEAATGYYSLTPIIASLAGADSVLALTRDSRFGRADDVIERTDRLRREMSAGKINVIVDRADRRIANADVVTNLGFVRPIDADLIRRLKSEAVISLMWEPWELRESDLDLAACRDHGIAILGTNEDHPRLQTIRYIGNLAIKLLFELDVEVMLSNVVVVGSGKFGDAAKTGLQNAGATVSYLNIGDGNSLADTHVPAILETADAVVFVEHSHDESLVGSDGQISASALAAINPSLAIAHICGNVDADALREEGLSLAPAHVRPFGFMSVATDYLGPRPLIDLHCAGLQVGAALARARRKGLDPFSAERTVADALELASRISDADSNRVQGSLNSKDQVS